MDEGQNAEIRATVRLGFADYVALQLWCKWVSTLRTVPVFVLSALVVGSAVVLIEGASLRDLLQALVEKSAVVGLWFLAGYLFIVFFPVVFVAVRWPFGKIPREMRFAFDDAGIHYSFKDVTVTLGWPSAYAYSETRAALYIRTKRVFLRLPKRDIPVDALRALFESKGLKRVSAWRFR